MMNWHDGTYTPRGICSFGITESIIAGGAWLGAELGLFGAGAAEAGGAALLGGEAALGAGEAGLFGAGLGEVAGAGLGGAEAGLFGAEAGADLFGFGGSLGGAAEGGGDLAALASGGGGGGASSGAATSFELGGAASEASTGLGELSKTAAGEVGQVAGGSTSVFDKLMSGISNNPLQAAGVGIAGAGLGYNMLQGSKDSAERKALGGNAQALGAQGQQLMSYLQEGKLPPGLQAQVEKDSAAARARIIQNHAQNGMPTDPSQNSALAQELNNVDQQAMIKTAQIGERLLASGITEIGMSNDLYAKLIGLDRQQSQSTGLAISNFAAALGGRPPQGQQQRQAA